MLDAMVRAGLLDAAAGLQLSRFRNAFLLAANFNRDRSVWRAHYYFDPSYRRALADSASGLSITSDVLLQIGHMSSLGSASTRLFATRKMLRGKWTQSSP